MTTYRLGYTRTFVEMPEEWRVLDVGSGHNPHPRADVLVEKYLADNTHRSHASVKKGHQSLVVAHAEALPFAAHSFDYVIASHVAEHIPDPRRFCSELARVGRRGYVETPSKLAERLLGEPFHRWYVSSKGDTLVFELIPHREKTNIPPWKRIFYGLYYFNRRRARPVMTSNHPLLRRSLDVLSLLLHKIFVYTRLGYTFFPWEDYIVVQVDEE